MKKILALSLVLVALVACQQKEAPKAVVAPAAETPTPAPGAPATAPMTDKK